jgi:hypothetical protein
LVSITERPAIGFRAAAAKSSRCDRHHRTIRHAVRISEAVGSQAIREEQAMSNDRPLNAAAHSKPAAGVSRLRAPNLFGPARDYLVNEIQKAEIIAMMITRRPILKRAVFVMVLVMWVLALASLVWLYGAGRDNPTPTDLVVMIVLMVAPMIAALHLAFGHALRPLRLGFTAMPRISPQAALA